jgi:peptide/nickel transport system permease protein
MTIVFALIHASGDPLDGFLAPGASEDVRQQARTRLGLDDPLPLQYLSYLGNALTGDFGISWRTSQPALKAVLERLPATLRLAAAAIAVSVSGGLTLGYLSARLNSGVIRFGVRLFALLGQARMAAELRE